MIAREIAHHLNAVPITLWDEARQNSDYHCAFATDLMSDVLAMLQSNTDKTVLLTGLANAQTLRTAEMMDINFVILVRGKYPQDETIEMAQEMGITMMATDLTMFDACGRLYKNGLGGIYG